MEHGFGGTIMGPSAYMLVYIKESYKKQLLEAVQPSDIPLRWHDFMTQKNKSASCAIL